MTQSCDHTVRRHNFTYHEIIFNKLNYYGVTGKELSWFRPCLLNKKQLKGHSSVTKDRIMEFGRALA